MSGPVTTTPEFRPFSDEELTAARLAPTCFVENYLYADLALVCAAGGTGKTTMLIHEAVCIALGFPVWGNRVAQPGKTLFITAEDSRELFAARLREVMDALRLTDQERARAVASIAVWDVSDQVARLACLDSAGNIQLTTLADDIVAAFKDQGIVQVVFDPAISFGPGERLVNDAEQAVVLAARRIIRGLNCCVRIIHHTGKANARNGAIDQYAGRGGSAFADGARMVTILSSLGDGSPFALPDGFTLQEGESGFILARAKLSYCAPQPNIFIRRSGYHFDHVIEERLNPEQRVTRDAQTVLTFLESELAAGRKHTARTLRDAAGLKLSRKRLDAALASLEVNGLLKETPLPEEERRGARKTYLGPLAHWGKPNSPLGQAQSPNRPLGQTTDEPLAHWDKPNSPIATAETAPKPDNSAIGSAESIGSPYRDNPNSPIEGYGINPHPVHWDNTNSPIATQWPNSDERKPPEFTAATSEGNSVGEGSISPESPQWRILNRLPNGGRGLTSKEIHRADGNGKRGTSEKMIGGYLLELQRAGLADVTNGRWVATGSAAHG